MISSRSLELACYPKPSVHICDPKIWMEVSCGKKPLRRKFLQLALGSLLALSFLGVPAQAADITVFAAASLKNALDDAAKAYEAKSGDKVVISYAASSALAKQIEGGAGADIFFSADLDWMDYLQEKNLIDELSKNPAWEYAGTDRAERFDCVSFNRKEFSLGPSPWA